MAFEFIPTELDGVVIIKNHQFLDNRGNYEKHYERNIFLENKIDFIVNESSDLYTKKGSIRGLHFQTVESQAKLVRALKGAIFDVIIDLRFTSKTFGKHYSIVLEEQSGISLFIPEGFAHGFLALKDDTIFSYDCSGRYLPEYCGGILWNDPSFDIKWPLKEYGIKELIVSDKDQSWPIFDKLNLINHSKV